MEKFCLNLISKTKNSKLPEHRRIFFFFFLSTFVSSMQPNLGRSSSYGWLPLQLHHKSEKIIIIFFKNEMKEHHNGEKKTIMKRTSASGYFQNSKNLQFSLQNWQRTISLGVVLFSLLLSFWEWWVIYWTGSLRFWEQQVMRPKIDPGNRRGFGSISDTRTTVLCNLSSTNYDWVSSGYLNLKKWDVTLSCACNHNSVIVISIFKWHGTPCACHYSG